MRLINDGSAVEITRYIGGRVGVRIPSEIQGLPVTAIGYRAFAWLDSNVPEVFIALGRVGLLDAGELLLATISLRSVHIPDSVTSIWGLVFRGNPLTSITIGNNVTFGAGHFMGVDDATGGFGRAFVEFYESQGRRAGTYTRSDDGSWSFEGREI